MPDLLASAGGVAVSYYEWATDIQRKLGSERAVIERLRMHMEDAGGESAECGGR